MSTKYTLILPQDGEAFQLPNPHGGIINFKLDPHRDTQLPLTVMINELPPGGEILPHQHSDLAELVVALTGSATAYLDTDSHIFSQGMIVLINPGTTHRLHNTSKETFRYLDILLSQDTFFSDYVRKIGKAL